MAAIGGFRSYLSITRKTDRIFGYVSAGVLGAYHLARKSGNFGLKSNGKVIFRKFRSEIVEYLQMYSSFSVRNGTAEISGAFHYAKDSGNFGRLEFKWKGSFRFLLTGIFEISSRGGPHISVGIFRPKFPVPILPNRFFPLI